MGGTGLGALFSAMASGAAWAWAGALGALAIGALYLIRTRRRRVVVAFAPLWLGPTGEAKTLRWARRWRHWLSLALALAVFGAIWLGGRGPRSAAVDRGGRSLVILIDRSASMSARDQPGTRLGAAKARAAELVAGLRPADRALVASFAAETVAESGFEADPRRLAEALAAVSPSDEPGDLLRALAFAAAVLRDRPAPTVVILSDGGFAPDQLQRPPPVGLDLRYLPVGVRARNVGILGFAARRLPADPGAVETALIVQSFGPNAAIAGVEILSGGTVVDRLKLELTPGERRRVVLADLFAPEARLEARLTHPPAEVDDLPGDDEAWATIPPLPRRRVLRVGGADLYLDGALLSLGRTVRVDRLAAEAADRALTLAPSYDLVIFDGATPSAPPATGRFLYLNPAGDGSPFPVRGTVRDPVLDPASLRREHPLLRQLDLSDVNLAEAHRLALGPGDLALAGSFGVPLIVARERPGLRVAALAFDPRRSDLPMRPAFPLLIANALGWATRDGDRSDAVRSGATPAAESETVRDARESDTTPAAALTLGDRPLQPPDPPQRHGAPRAHWLALLLAVVLLLFEWVSYHRRWTA
jgi:hypothetical protein